MENDLKKRLHDSQQSRLAEEKWGEVLREIELQVNKLNFKTWFKPTIGLDLEEGCMTVRVPNSFIADYLDQTQRSLIERLLDNVVGKDTKVRFRVGQPAEQETAE